MDPSMRSFTCFSRLPKDLRLHILTFTLSPRVVNLIYVPKEDKFFSFNSKVPAMLHVCRESRAFSLRGDISKLSFGTKSHRPSIFFDFASDILFFDDWYASTWSRPRPTPALEYPEKKRRLRYPEGPMAVNEMQRIERLAVNYSFVEKRNPDLAKYVRARARAMLECCPNMKTFIVVLDSEAVCNDPTSGSLTAGVQIRFVDIPFDSDPCLGACKYCITKHTIGEDLCKYPSNDSPHNKLVAAIRGESSLSDSPCLKRYIDFDDFDEESVTATDPEVVEEGIFAPGMNDRDEDRNSEDRELSDTIELDEGELLDLIKDEEVFRKEVGYSIRSVENTAIWVGPDYLERRVDL